MGAPTFEGHDPVGGVTSSAPSDHRRLLVAVVALVMVIGLVLVGTTGTDRPPSAEVDDRPGVDVAPAPRPDDRLQRELDAGIVRYRTRPVGLTPVRVATDGPDGYVGLARWQGAWYRASSPDGIAWTTDVEAPIDGVPEAFRPGMHENQHDRGLRWIDGRYWGRFVSERTAGAERAVLLLSSDDLVRWSAGSPRPASLGVQRLGPLELGDPSEFLERWLGGSSIQQSVDGGRSYFVVPDLLPGVWEPIEVASSSAGAAILFYGEGVDSYRLALTVDGRDWHTVALRERGPHAVRIIVVGAEDVLLTAADPQSGPIELIVPLPDDPTRR